jgi:hypothetical protein
VLGRTRRRLGNGGRDRSRSALRQNDTIHASRVGRAKQRTEVMRIFDTIEREQKRMLPVSLRRQQIFNPQKLSLLHHSQHALVGIRASEPGELISWFNGDADACHAAQFDQPFQAIVPAFAGDADMIELA